MKRYLDRGLAIIIVVLTVAALLGSVYMLTNTLLDERPEVKLYSLDVVDYVCTHFSDGSFECYSEDDPDIGFGRSTQG